MEKSNFNYVLIRPQPDLFNKELKGTYKLLVILFLIIIYFISGKVSLNFAFLNQSVSPIWIPTGISIAAFIIWGFKIWPAIFIGAFLVNITTTGTVFSSLGMAIGNTLEGVTGLYLINKFIRDKKIFERPLNIFKYIFLVGLVATFLSAIIGVTSLYLENLIDPWNFSMVLTTWWLGDLGGVLIVAPVLLLWISDYKINKRPRKIFEAVLIFLLLISTSLIIFDNIVNFNLPFIINQYPFTFITIPILLLIAFRFSMRETASAIFIFTALALMGSLNGSFRLSYDNPNLSLLNLQIFVSLLFFTIMPVSAAITKQRKLEEALHINIERHSAISGLGISSLSGNPIAEIMRSSINLLMKFLNIDYCKILKLLPDGKEFLLIEGTGWKDGLVGNTKVGADLNSQAGYTLLAKEPVIVSDLTKEKRFNEPQLLQDHNVISGMSCIIYGKEKPYGVLGVHTKTKVNFSREDINFMQSVANIIALTVERNEFEEEIISSLNEKQILLKEVHHRVKNNLQIISSLLSLQSGHLSENNFRDFFIKSQNRIKSIAIVHEMLYRSENLSKINFRNYIDELSKYISESYNAENIKINVNSDELYFDTDVTINLGLIINEIIANSVKHAFSDYKSGTISIQLKNENNNYFLNIKDDGKGLPHKFDLTTTKTLGMHLISSLVTQIDGQMEIKNNIGTEYLISFRLN